MSDQNLPAVMPQALPPSVFTNIPNFDKAIEIATALSQSSMVPETYRDQKTGPANVLIALELSLRMGLSILTVMQNLDIIQGRPCWTAKFQAGQVNASGKYKGGLHYEWEDREEKSVEYKYWKKDYATGKSNLTAATKKIKDKACRVWAIEAATGERINGPWFSLEMAVKFGLYDRNNSQWPLDPENMLMKRAVSRFVSNYCPEATLGLMAQEEAGDVIDADFTSADTPPPLARPQDEPAPPPAREQETAEAEAKPTKPKPAEPKPGRAAKTTESKPSEAASQPQEQEKASSIARPKEEDGNGAANRPASVPDNAPPDDDDNPF